MLWLEEVHLSEIHMEMKCIPGVMVLRNGASGHESGVRALEAEGGLLVQLLQAGTYTIFMVCVIPTS